MMPFRSHFVSSQQHHAQNPRLQVHLTAPYVHSHFDGREVFVGNLSFFCDEVLLAELFITRCGATVLESRIMYNKRHSKSLLYGFVTLSDPMEARDCAKVLNGQFFLGRCIRTSIESREEHGKRPFKVLNSPRELSFQLHVQFASNFHPDDPKIVRPTELFLRRIFFRYGVVLDVAVKDYEICPAQQIQKGYGFVTFDQQESVEQILCQCPFLVVQGIVISCSPRQQEINVNAMLVQAAHSGSQFEVRGTLSPRSFTSEDVLRRNPFPFPSSQVASLSVFGNYSSMPSSNTVDRGKFTGSIPRMV